MFSIFATPWKFILLSVSSCLLSPYEEKKRILPSFILAFFIFLIFISPELEHYQAGSYQYASDESFRFIEGSRAYLLGRSEGLNENAKNIYQALVLGKLDYSSDFSDLIRKQGIVHLFVVSGFHFSILFFIIRIIFQKILKISYNKTSIAIILLSTYYYMILGGGFGATRAYLTIVINIVILFLGRKVDDENILFLIAFFWIILDPAVIYQIGFQLTFVATYLLILVQKIPIMDRLESDVLKNLMISLLVSLGISSFLFFKGESVAIFSFLLIAISAPIISFLMILMFLFALIFSNVMIIDEFFIFIINLICDIYSNFLNTFSNLASFRYLMPLNLAILVECGIIFLFFSRKMLSYDWDKRGIIILFFICIFCFMI